MNQSNLYTIAVLVNTRRDFYWWNDAMNAKYNTIHKVRKGGVYRNGFQYVPISRWDQTNGYHFDGVIESESFHLIKNRKHLLNHIIQRIN